MRDDKAILWIFSLLAITALFFIGSETNVGWATTNDTVQISVNISNITEVDINPSAINWNGSDIHPGDVVTGAKEANGYGNIWIENIGSVNITHIWFNSTNPSELPFGTGDPSKYNAGNFVVIDNSTDGSGNYSFVHRVEYDEDDSMYITLPDNVGEAEESDMFGRFRNASKEWFFAVNAGSSGNCSDGFLYMSSEAKTSDSNGDTNLNDSTAIPLIDVSSVRTDWIGWAATNVSIGGEQYCVAVDHGCNVSIFHRFNHDAPGAGEAGVCGNVPAYFSEDELVPGAMKKAWIRAHIPLGVPYWGTITEGTLTVFVDTT